MTIEPARYDRHMSSDTQPRSSSWAARLIAVLVLAVAGWILLKVVIGLAVAFATTVIVILAVIAVVWALRTLF